MTCTNPLYLYLRGTYPIYVYSEEQLHQLNKPKFEEWPGFYQIKVPCGHCIGCKLDRANEWATRVWCECQTWKNSCFITLTYNSGKRNKRRKGELEFEYNLPTTETGRMTLYKKDFTNFMKRLRKQEKGIESWINPINNKVENPIRFLMCGEYGPKNGRPHYHACIFNWTPDDLVFEKYNKNKDALYKSKKLQKIWGHGFVLVGNLTYKSACYVARYTMKKAGFEKQHYEKIDVEEINKKTGEIKLKVKRIKIEKKGRPIDEFINMSRMPGIGLQYFNKNFKIVKRNSGILIEGKLKKIPKYFKRKWEEKNWEDFHRWRLQYIKTGKQLFENILNKTIPNDIHIHQKEKIFQRKIEEKLKEIIKLNKLPRENIVVNTC